MCSHPSIIIPSASCEEPHDWPKDVLKPSEEVYKTPLKYPRVLYVQNNAILICHQEHTSSRTYLISNPPRRSYLLKTHAPAHATHHSSTLDRSKGSVRRRKARRTPASFCCSAVISRCIQPRPWFRPTRASTLCETGGWVCVAVGGRHRDRDGHDDRDGEERVRDGDCVRWKRQGHG